MATTLAQSIHDSIRWVADFPQKTFILLTSLRVLADPQIFNGIMRQMADSAEDVDIIAGLDARGFLISAGVAVLKDVGVLALRKAGKLPPPVHHVDYGLDTGEAALEIPAEGFGYHPENVSSLSTMSWRLAVPPKQH
ncbi:MAG: hypothetical protein U1U88_000134 [Lawsonella clevelandensis]